MTHFIDRRLNPKGKSLANRQRFLRRARTRFDRARLQRLRAKGGQGGFDDPGAAGTLWRAWRAARGR